MQKYNYNYIIENTALYGAVTWTLSKIKTTENVL